MKPGLFSDEKFPIWGERMFPKNTFDGYWRNNFSTTRQELIVTAVI